MPAVTNECCRVASVAFTKFDKSATPIVDQKSFKNRINGTESTKQVQICLLLCY